MERPPSTAIDREMDSSTDDLKNTYINTIYGQSAASYNTASSQSLLFPETPFSGIPPPYVALEGISLIHTIGSDSLKIIWDPGVTSWRSFTLYCLGFQIKETITTYF